MIKRSLSFVTRDMLAFLCIGMNVQTDCSSALIRTQMASGLQPEQPQRNNPRTIAGRKAETLKRSTSWFAVQEKHVC